MKFNQLFKSYDSKYFLYTAFKLTAVSVAMLALLSYSLWFYLELNYSFFLSQGYFSDPEMKEVFIDKLFAEQLDFFAYVGVYLVGVFFTGMLLAHFVLRPFSKVAKLYETISKGEPANFNFDPMTSSKLVVKSSRLLLDFLKHNQIENAPPFVIPQAIKNITKPKTDYVFYFQYACLMFIMSSITILACYFFAHQIHSSIIDSATQLLKSNKAVSTFLGSQTDSIDMIVWVSGILSVGMYAAIARGIIRDIEGVSFGYLRDIKDVASGATSKRLHPRVNDPGKEAAAMINKVLDVYFESKIQAHVTHLPPAFVQKFINEKGEEVYSVVTPEGEEKQGLKYDEVISLVKKAC